MASPWSRPFRGCLAGLVLVASVAAAAAPGVRTDRPYAVLGETEAVEVTVLPSRPDAVLRTAVNAGTLTPRGPQRGPERHFTYAPPPERAPRVALLAFWEEGGAPPELAVHRLPLHGRMALQVSTRPGAQVTVQVGGRDFGPARASAAGGLSVDVEVPPGTTTAAVRARLGRQEKTTALPLSVPASNPLLAVLTSPVPAPGQATWLWVVHADALPGPLLEFSSRGVKLERVRFRRDRALFRVTRLEDGRAPHIEVRLTGQPEARAELTPAEP